MGVVACILLPGLGRAQILNDVALHGDFQVDAQYYKQDSLIGAPNVPERILMNAFSNFILTAGKFSAGVRYEAYLNPLQGFDPRYKGSGFPYRFASYNGDNLQITVGNFYEQFGSGMIFRSYEERGLGVDNAMDGIRLRFSPRAGINLKGIYGRQRAFWDLGRGIVRGLDAEVSLNDAIPLFAEANTRVMVGGGFISKFQEDDNPTYNLPENVAASSVRTTVSNGPVSVSAEYAHKINDPSFTNGYIYKSGEALLVTATYSQKGLGLMLGAKRVDNMDFRSERDATLNVLNINFLPALTKQHTYNLSASIYPYATQPLGEMSYQGELTYFFKRESLLGGRYGTNLTVNYSKVKSLHKTPLGDESSDRKSYKSDFFRFGDKEYFQDLNVEVHKKFTNKLKATAMYQNLHYNQFVVQGIGLDEIIKAHIGVVDVTYKLTSKHILRTELQTLQTKQDMGSWAMGLLEYTLAPHWFVAVMDQYNYGNEDEAKQVHYIIGSVGYNKNTSRVAVSYGRQRAGIVCVGGVCRNVPASNGLTVSISSSF